jgi:DNA repair exonuclease SbcCD ATPase subunit
MEGCRNPIPSLTHDLLSLLLVTVGNSLKRLRHDHSSPQKDVTRVVEEQASLIDSLKKDKTGLETNLTCLKTDHDRIIKENQILRRAVTIQQDRQTQAENELKAAHQYRNEAEDKMKKLDQVILSLRYHLQAQQPSYGNDFLNNRSHDVF